MKKDELKNPLLIDLLHRVSGRERQAGRVRLQSAGCLPQRLYTEI